MKKLKNLFTVLVLLIVTCQFHEVKAISKPKPLQKIEAVTEKRSQEVVVAKPNTPPVYEDVISDISLTYNGPMLNGDITLNSGGVFHIVDYRTRDDNALNKWRVGDRITFDAYVKKEKLILVMKKLHKGKPDNLAEPCVIFDNINSSKDCLKIIEIREDGKIVKLSDNSIWEFSFLNRWSTQDWKVGERVLVYGNGKKSQYSFINLDVPVQHNVYSATGTFVIINQ